LSPPSTYLPMQDLLQEHRNRPKLPFCLRTWTQAFTNSPHSTQDLRMTAYPYEAGAA
jgi:hypothetical protein